MPPELTPLLNLGTAGAMLCWFMFRTEPRLKGIEDAIDRLTRTNLLQMMASESSQRVKDECQKLLVEIEEAEKARRPK